MATNGMVKRRIKKVSTKELLNSDHPLDVLAGKVQIFIKDYKKSPLKIKGVNFSSPCPVMGYRDYVETDVDYGYTGWQPTLTFDVAKNGKVTFKTSQASPRNTKTVVTIVGKFDSFPTVKQFNKIVKAWIYYNS